MSTGPEYETIAGCGSNLGIFDPHTVAEMNFYCDAYGLDTISVGTGIAFVMECFEMGLINETHTGGLELRFGNRLACPGAVASNGGWRGLRANRRSGGPQNESAFCQRISGRMRLSCRTSEWNPRGLEFSEYMTKESLAQQGGYGLALKGPQHDEAWLIFLDMVHNYMPTLEQKAEALHWFPMFRTWFGLCGLCKLPWNDIVPEDNKDSAEPAKVMKHVQWYADYFSAITGNEAGPDDLIKMSEAFITFSGYLTCEWVLDAASRTKSPTALWGRLQRMNMNPAPSVTINS